MKIIRTLRKLITNSLGFSNTEANGFLLLLVFTISFALFSRIYFSHSALPISKSNTKLSDWVQEMNKSIQENKKANINEPPSKKLAAFNPNSSSIAEMINAGVPELIAKRITLYRDKGGHFHQAEDIRKIYGLDAELATKLIPYVIIETATPAKEKTTERSASFEPTQRVNYSFELNTTVAEELQLIKGIGPVLSERIIKYRERLGGFHSYTQLDEVYGLKPEVIEELRNQTTLITKIRTFDINNDSLKVLIRHPYMNYDLARIILNYRKVHGNFERAEDVRNIKILSDSLYLKLYPYLSK
jgi:competence protein ComEA